MVVAADGQLDSELERQYRQEKEQLKHINFLMEQQRKKEAGFIQAQLPFNEREIPFTEEDVFRLGGGTFSEERDDYYSLNPGVIEEEIDDY